MHLFEDGEEYCISKVIFEIMANAVQELTPARPRSVLFDYI